MQLKITDVGPLIGINPPFCGQEIELFGLKMWIQACAGTRNGEVIDDFEITLVTKDHLSAKRELRDALISGAKP